MKKSFLLTAAVFAVFAGTGVAQATSTVTTNSGVVPSTTNTTVAKNPDGSTTTTTTTYYVDYDKNNNGILDSNEFYTYAYRIWDTDRDGFLSDEEWKLNTVRWYGPTNTTYQTYTYWDKNADGRIDATEFDSTGAATKLYSVWDVNADNQITNDEYATSSFRIYDVNGDGVLSVDEWKGAL